MNASPIIAGIILAIALCWPIPTPILQQTRDNTALPLYGNQSIHQDFTPQTSVLDGIDVQVQDAAVLPSSTNIILSIHQGDHTIKTIHAPLGKILSSNTLRFRFFPVIVPSHQSISFELAAPSLHQQRPLFVRYFNDTKELSYSIFSPQPQIASLVRQILHTDTAGTDIALTYTEGGNIIKGINPYNRILQGNLQDNESYATYLPSFYLLSAASQLLGLHSYASWIQFWRPIFLLFALATSVLLFSMFWRKGLYVLAFFSAGFFLFNRWSLYIATVGLFDFIPIFFLVLSLVLHKKKPFLSLLLCGLSLSFRHIGAILLPLYIIELWQSSPPEQRWRRIIFGIASLIAIPLAVSLPFIHSNAASFVKSMLFSFTRAPVTHFDVPSADAFLGLIGPSAKIGLLIFLGLVFYSYARKYTGFFVSAFVAFIIFLDFHSVWFAQYMAYAAPLLMLAFLEVANKQVSNIKIDNL